MSGSEGDLIPLRTLRLRAGLHHSRIEMGSTSCAETEAACIVLLFQKEKINPITRLGGN
jgi:hypothetical protein